MSNTAGDSLAATQPDLALAWSTDHAAALAELAQRQLDSEEGEPNLASIGALAQRALQRDPLSENALRVIALVADATGDDPRAESLMRLVEARSLRDLRAQSWLFSRELLDSHYADALKQVDVMLRAWPIGGMLLPTLVGLANDSEGVEPLLDVLRGDPPWRSWFLIRLPDESPDPRTLADFYAKLLAEPVPLKVAELRPYLDRLIEIGDIAQAHSLWIDFLPPDANVMPGDVNNGGFEYPVRNLPFEWVIGQVDGAATSVVSEADQNHALRVAFHNTRVPFRHVSQLLLLEPGAFRLTGRVKSQDLQSERGLQWTIFCAGESDEVLAQTERVAGTLPWSVFEVSFDVPASGCKSQMLRLELPARVPAEQEIAGSIWFDDLRIARLSDAAHTR